MTNGFSLLAFSKGRKECNYEIPICVNVCVYSTFELLNKWTSFHKIFNDNSAIRCHLNLIELYFNFLLQSADDQMI